MDGDREGPGLPGSPSTLIPYSESYGRLFFFFFFPSSLSANLNSLPAPVPFSSCASSAKLVLQESCTRLSAPHA